MAERDQTRQPTHRAYSVVKLGDGGEYWCNIGFVYAHDDDRGFDVELQAYPLGDNIVCRPVSECDADPTAIDSDHSSGGEHVLTSRTRPL